MLSFTPTEEQKMLLDMLHKFADSEMRAQARECDETREIPRSLVDTGWEMGLIPSNIPAQYGGFGEEHSMVTSVLALEELAWGDVSMALYLMTPALFAMPVLLQGTEEQKTLYLPRFCGESFYPATAAFVEPVMQFAPAHMQTTARRVGDAYVLNGKKAYVPLAADAEVMLVYANEGGTTQAFIVPADADGVRVLEREKHMGLRALPTFQVALEDAQVPLANRLGGEAGIDLNRLLPYMRAAAAAVAVGVARASFEYARDYAKERVQFGEPIAHRQAIAFMLAEMAIDIDGLRLMTWETSWKLDQGQDASREAYLTKLTADDVAVQVTDRGVQVLGGYGYIREFPVEMWLRNGRGIAVLEGLVIG